MATYILLTAERGQELLSAAEFGRRWHANGGDRERLAEELTQALQGEGLYAPRSDESEALDAFDNAADDAAVSDGVDSGYDCEG